MKVKDNVEIIVEYNPEALDLKQRLMHDASTVNYSMSYETNVQAKMSSYKTSTPTTDVLINWIAELIDKHSSFRRRGYNLYFCNLWFAKYDIGDYTKVHEHALSFFSFVYFINCPEGSAPFVFTTSGEEIKAEEGKIVIFPGRMLHNVPENGCKNRIVLAGNVDLLPSRR